MGQFYNESHELISTLHSHSSLNSQQSLQSVPSLTQTTEQHSSTAAAYHCSATLKNHTSYIFSLTLAGKNLYTGASNGEICLYNQNPDNSSQNNHILLTKGYSAVKSIVVSQDNKFLITAHQDHKIRVWNIEKKHKLVEILPTLNDRCMGIISAKNNVNHIDAVSDLALSQDGKLLYSVSWDRTLKVWRTSDFKNVGSVNNAHEDAINAIVLSEDGFIYSGSADKTIKVWKKIDGEKRVTLISTLVKHKSSVNALALSSDGVFLYSGACDRSIIVWEKDNSAEHMIVAGALRGHSKAILCLCVVGDLLCSGSADKTVRIWRGGIGKSFSCLAVLEGHKSAVKCITVDFDNSDSAKSASDNSGDSYLVYSGSLDFELKVWRVLVPFS